MLLPAEEGRRMTDTECTAFLQWALPRLRRRWGGYRKVRRLVAKRLVRRLRALGLADLAAYRLRLEVDRAEWDALDALLGIPISRFYRDREVFGALECDVLPALAQAARRAQRTTLVCWSAGCASGEEPYTLALVWGLHIQPRHPGLALRIVATDCDAQLLERARAGCYAGSSLKELPPDLRAAAFDERDGQHCVRPQWRCVEFLRQDLRHEMPDGLFDLVLLRNVVATYYAPELQRDILQRVAARMPPGGALVLGSHESLPTGASEFSAWPGTRCIYRRHAPA
jgi:chemotaxis protein methyltransferase CheR